VGSVLQLSTGVARIIETEDEGPGSPGGEIAHLGVVAVDNDGGIRQRRDGAAPAGGDVLQLAVAVELVAEEVAEKERPRPEPRRQLRESRLVGLEEAQLGVALPEEGGGDARDEIRAGAVRGQAEPRPQN